MDLKKRLSKRIGMQDIYEITFQIRENEQFREELYELAFDDSLANNALWVMTHFSVHQSEWLCEKQNELIDEVLKTTDPTKLRLLLTILNKQPLANPLRVEFLDFCLTKMSSIKEPPATSVMCMKLAYELCRPIPELLREYTVILETMEVEFLSTWGKTIRKKIQKAILNNRRLPL